jgi:hypothetical protein
VRDIGLIVMPMAAVKVLLGTPSSRAVVILARSMQVGARRGPTIWCSRVAGEACLYGVSNRRHTDHERRPGSP